MRAAVLAIALLSPESLWAAGFELSDQSVLAAGAGGTGVARQGDSGAAWYNPAALADGRGLRAGVALFLAVPRLSASPATAGFTPSGQSTSNELGVATPFSAHLGWSRDRYALGLYAGTSHGSSVVWPVGWWGRFDAQSSSVRVIRAAPSFAVRLGPVRLGVGVHIDYAVLELERTLDFVDAEGSSHLRLSGMSAGGDASIYWQAMADLAFGLTYKSRTVMNLSGEATFKVPDSFSSRAPDQTITSNLILPDRLALGTAWSRGLLTLFADATLTLWSVRDVVRIDFSSPANKPLIEPQRWSESFSLRVGLEESVHPRVTLRGGIYYDQQAAPAETLAPSSPDMARFGLTVGGSLQLQRSLAVDLSYSLAILLPRDSSSPDAIPASFSGQIHMIGIAFRAAQASPTSPNVVTR